MDWKISTVYKQLKKSHKFNQGQLAHYLNKTVWPDLDPVTIRRKVSNFSSLDQFINRSYWFELYVTIVNHLDLSPRDISSLDSHDEIVAALIKEQFNTGKLTAGKGIVPIKSIAIELEDGLFKSVSKDVMSNYMEVGVDE